MVDRFGRGSPVSHEPDRCRQPNSLQAVSVFRARLKALQVFSAEPGTASAAAWNPIFEWVPSQKGFFVDAPQRQSTVLAWVAITFPFVSRSSIVPVTIYGPFGLASIITSAMSNPPPGVIFLPSMLQT